MHLTPPLLHYQAKVIILIEEGVGLVVCELAVLKGGGAFVPLDANWPTQRQVSPANFEILCGGPAWLVFVVRVCCKLHL